MTSLYNKHHLKVWRYLIFLLKNVGGALSLVLQKIR